MKRLVLLVVAACAAEPAAAPAPLVAANVQARQSPAPPRPNLFLAKTVCVEPNQLCPVDPPFPRVLDLGFDAGRPCITGSDRQGCLERDGWVFHARAGRAPAASQRATFGGAPPACRVADPGWSIPLAASGTTLFWRSSGERMLAGADGCRALPSIPLEPVRTDTNEDGVAARDPNDVWTWTPSFVSHFDGTQWERTLMTPPCIRKGATASPVVAPDGSIWFVRCEQQKHVLVRFDPRSRLATATGLSPVLGLALVGDKVTATDFGEDDKKFRRHVFEPGGREVSVEETDRVFLRAGFPDGTAFAAPFELFSEIARIGGSLAMTIAMPTPAEGFYAASPHEVWAGGESLYRWRDGVMGKVAYRPDPANTVVTAIAGSGPSDVWVASRTAQKERGIHLSHWDGTTWQQLDLPSDASEMFAFAVAGPNDAWLTTQEHLFHWNGVSWTSAGDFPRGQGLSIALTPDAVWVLGNSTIYRRSR